MDDHAVEAVRAKPDSSLVRAVRAVADGEADAVVSAGSTGAMLAASLLHIRRLPGVYRPAIAVVIPARRGPTVLIDAGANADARAEHLLQFAHMGAVFAEEILGVADPEVRLLSIGEEDEKGNELTLEAHELLRRGATFASAGTRRAAGCSRATRTSSSPTASRQRRAQGDRGDDPEPARRTPRRARVVHPREARRRSIRPAAASSGGSTRRTYGGAYLLELSGSW